MGFTAAALALIIALILVAIIGYHFRDPHRYNARKTVWQTAGAGRPHDKIQ